MSVIEDFLAYYPSTTDNNFYDSIFKKEEFYENKLDKYEDIPKTKGTLLKHQEIVARFLSPYTTYDSLLLLHIMGSGKTCSAVGTAELALQQHSTINRAIVLVKGKSLLENFKRELVFVCTKGQYIPDDYDGLSDKAKVSRINKNLRQNYYFDTYTVFAKNIKKLSDAYITKYYSNSIIIIDEVHNLKLSDKEEGIDVYRQIHRFLHLIDNKKILLMSGTPMKDKPSEIADVMNLILPVDKQLPVDSKFNKKYLVLKKDGTYKVKKVMKSDLKSYFKGRVSFLRSKTINTKYEGESIGRLDYLHVFTDRMGVFQDRIYSKAYHLDRQGSEKGIYSNSRQAVLSVYPDGSYGSKGYDKYIREIKIKTIMGERSTKFILSDEFYREIRADSTDDMLSNLYKFSSKYATVIRYILTPGENCFVYCNLVKGSGIILFSKILELFGFKEYKEGNVVKSPRYAILSGKTSGKRKIQSILKQFNSSNNRYGEYIKIIIGSRVAGEGLTLKNIRQSHILTPHWNYTETIQSIFRTIRLGSHRDLLADGVDVVVKIFQHVSLPTEQQISIDLIMYQISEDKDISIKRIEYLMKISAMDCALNYTRNHMPPEYDGERICDYRKCDYKCDDINHREMTVNPDQLDRSTYELYYDDKDISNIIKHIQDLFRVRFSVSLKTMASMLTQYTQNQILTSLSKMITESISIRDKYGFVNYLREENNLYFLTSGLSTPSNYLNIFYVQKPTVKSIISYKEIILNQKLSNNTRLVKNFCSNPRKSIINQLPINIQEMIVEISISNRDRIDQSKINWLLTYYKPSLINIDNTIVSSLDSGTLRCMDTNTKSWSNCNDKLIRQFHSIDADKRKNIIKRANNKYYGILEKNTNKFRIRDITSQDKISNEDAREETKGKVCISGSWKKHELLKAAHTLQMDYDSPDECTKTKAELIKILSSGKKNKLTSVLNVNTLSKVDLCRLYYFNRFKVNDICSLFRKWFDKEDLILEINVK